MSKLHIYQVKCIGIVLVVQKWQAKQPDRDQTWYVSGSSKRSVSG